MNVVRNRPNGFALWRDLKPSLVALSDCQPLGREARRHPPGQVRKLARSLDQFGFVYPILIDEQTRVVAGRGLVLAARQLGLTEVPAVRLADLPESGLRALRLALNRITDEAVWDGEALKLEFAEILELDAGIDLQETGFEMGEIDSFLDDFGLGQEDELPESTVNGPQVTGPGDLWVLGEHRLLCGDARSADSYDVLLGPDRARMLFTDPPYNVAADRISGLGAVKHANFAMASGELSSEQFRAFLRTSLGHAAQYSANGAVHFVCMDWRHVKELLGASEVYSEQLNLCVWKKSNAGMGSLYRSQHEFVFVFKVGNAPHTNNVALGRYGRHRTNVWDYVSQNALNGTTKSKLALHPTVKPVAMIADAIRDCSNRNDVILDPFGGAGTTIIAAEQTGRRARLIEIDPLFVTISIERWQRLTGGTAVRAQSGKDGRSDATASVSSREDR
jgi:DNA methylase